MNELHTVHIPQLINISKSSWSHLSSPISHANLFKYFTCITSFYFHYKYAISCEYNNYYYLHCTGETVRFERVRSWQMIGPEVRLRNSESRAQVLTDYQILLSSTAVLIKVKRRFERRKCLP